MNKKTILLYILCSILVATSMMGCRKMRCGSTPPPSDEFLIDWYRPNGVQAVLKTLKGYDDERIGEGYPYYWVVGREITVTGWFPEGYTANQSGMDFVPRCMGDLLFSDDSTKWRDHEDFCTISVHFPQTPDISDSVQKCIVQKVEEGSKTRKKCIIKATIKLGHYGNNMSCQGICPKLEINTPEDIRFVE